jgi:hypothetical protein
VSALADQGFANQIKYNPELSPEKAAELATEAKDYVKSHFYHYARGQGTPQHSI